MRDSGAYIYVYTNIVYMSQPKKWTFSLQLSMLYALGSSQIEIMMMLKMTREKKFFTSPTTELLLQKSTFGVEFFL